MILAHTGPTGEAYVRMPWISSLETNPHVLVSLYLSLMSSQAKPFFSTLSSKHPILVSSNANEANGTLDLLAALATSVKIRSASSCDCIAKES